MFTASNQTVRVGKPSVTRQAKTVAQQLHPFQVTGSWEDMVTAVSMALFAMTLLFLVVVG